MNQKNFCVHCKHYAYVENIASCTNENVVRQVSEEYDAVACILVKEPNCAFWECADYLTKEVKGASVQSKKLVGNC